MIHKNYLLLKPEEKTFLDELLSEAMKQAPEVLGHGLCGDDRAEIAAEALATWFVASRKEL
jgi:hypothetical protein